MRRLQPIGAYDLSDRLGAGAPGGVDPATSRLSVDGVAPRIDWGAAALSVSVSRPRTEHARRSARAAPPEQGTDRPFDARSARAELRRCQSDMATFERRLDDARAADVIGRRRPGMATFERRLDGARAADVIGRSAAGDVPDPREIAARMSPRVARILLKALAKPRARRYATVDQLHTDLEEHARHEGLLVRPTHVARICAMVFMKPRRTAPQVVRSG